MSQKGTTYEARPVYQRKCIAARMLASGSTVVAVAAETGFKVTTIAKWRALPKFQVLLKSYEETINKRIMDSGVASKVARLRRLDAHVERIERVVEERGADPAMANVPGGATGLLAHDIKSVGSGIAAKLVDTYEFDSALAKSYLATLEQAAKEMGGQYEGSVQSGAAGPGVSITISFPTLDPAQVAEVAAASIIDLPPAARRLLQRPGDGKPL